MSEDRSYYIRLLWIKDPDLFAQYQEKARPLVSKHGLHIERWLVAEEIDGENLEKPDEIVVGWFKNDAARRAFEEDPESKALVALREEAASLVPITAKSIFGDR